MRIFVIFFTGLFFSAFVFAETVNGQWHAGIGDPTLFGWLTVAFYACATYFSFKQYQRLKSAQASSNFWLYLAVMLLLLGINKQLDLQSLFTELLRSHAVANGWYEQRRVWQSIFIVVLGVGMLTTLLSLRVWLAKSWHQYKLAWFGVIMLCTFVLMRAASFHHFDMLINVSFLGLRANVLFEMGALVFIIIAAVKTYPLEGFFEEGVVEAESRYVELQTDEVAVQCPECDFPAISMAAEGRRFKCKKCGHKYTTIIHA